MYKIEIGNKVRYEGKIWKITYIHGSTKRYNLELEKDHHCVYTAVHENYFELITEYKTLLHLWVKSKRHPFKAIGKNGDIIQVIGILDGIAVHISSSNTKYRGVSIHYHVWQLYQEPEEEVLIPSKKQCDVQAPTQEEVDDLITGIHEPAVKCEHNQIKNCFDEPHNKNVIFCIDCQAELDEKWLWYVYNHATKTWDLHLSLKAENEVVEYFHDRIIKKATWSRELSEVENDQ